MSWPIKVLLLSLAVLLVGLLAAEVLPEDWRDLVWRVRRFSRWLKWLLTGRRMIAYPGFMCGCCGAWRDIPFEVPEWDSEGEWADTIGLCPDWETRHEKEKR